MPGYWSKKDERQYRHILNSCQHSEKACKRIAAATVNKRRRKENRTLGDTCSKKATELALGRIFKLLSRPYRKGDIEQYEEARRVLLETNPEPDTCYQVCWARDRHKGAKGD